MDSRLAPELQHHSYLASYGLWKGKRLPWPIREGSFIFGDSGGFSVVASGAKLDPRQVLAWQMKYCTAGVILDIPPYRFGGKSQFVGSAADAWDESIQRTVGNVQRAAPLYVQHLKEGTLSPFWWYGAVQGESYTQLEEWYTRVAEVYPFGQAGNEGWALAPKPCNDIPTVVRFMRLAREKQMKRIHVLQTASPQTVGVMMALAKLGGVEWVTHDSASIHINTANRNAFLDNGSWWGSWGNNAHRAGWNALFSLLTTNCDCVACSWVREDTFAEKTYTERHYRNRLLLHSFLNIRALEARMHAAVESDAEGFLKVIADTTYGEVLREWEGRPSPRAVRTVSLLDRFKK
jgi:hypothetical protein